MFWKAVFVCLVAAVVGVMWQSEEYRRMLISELVIVRDYINAVTGRYEGWQVVFVTFGLTILISTVMDYLFGENIYTVRQRASRLFFRLVRKIPGVGSKIKREVDKTLDSMAKHSLSTKPGETHRTELPKKGLSHDEVMKEVVNIEGLANVDWKKGYVSGALYYSSPELTKLSTAVFEKFVWSNPLHVDVFPHVRKMEAEVVQWTVKLFNGGGDAGGIMTSGGTESIVLAMRAYREWGYERGIMYPEIVCPVSVHCAFNKAAQYFRMKLVQVPVDSRTRMVDLKAMSKAITSNTIVLVGSAPQYPHGVIDPIQDIAKLALKHNIGLHVDCCLGGFILPFMEKAGFKLDPFDFRVKGVTSISADTHKYGYTPKGTSVVMYSNKALRQKQYFVDPNWQGGVYATPGISGSRAGCLIATTWATLMYMGEDGYVDTTRRIIETARAIVKGLEGVAGIRVIGKPQAMVVAFDSADFDVYRLADALRLRGWYLNVLQYPPSFHLCVTMVHTQKGVADRFINDVKECVADLLKSPKAKATGQAAFYGLSMSIPDRSIIDEIAKEYLDMLFKAIPPKRDE